MSNILNEYENNKRLELIKLLQEAAEIVLKYIEKFKDKSEYKLTVDNLNMGLRNLEAGVNLLTIRPEWFKERLERSKEKRGGFGALSRGFGEFLWQGEDWQREIMDAVHKIEDYYENM